MKATPPTLEQVSQLRTLIRITAPPDYEDENRHMNVRYYLAIFDQAGYPLVASFGITPEFHTEHGTGGFDLEHHLHYFHEVRIGDTVSVTARLLARSTKRIHYMMFMVNETAGNLAATFECVNSFADLTVRKTAPYPPELAAKIDSILAVHQALDWEAPVCGVMGA